jgi:hypothetical protein
MDAIVTAFFSSDFVRSLLGGIVSGSVIAAFLGALLQRRTEEIKSEYAKTAAIFQSTRTWKERSVSELLGPLYIQFDRTKRAFRRWEEKNLYLEAKVIGAGNLTMRDLLLTKPHLIPPELLEDAGQLVEHYDRWLEEYEKLRQSKKPDLDTPFAFAGTHGFPFPGAAETKFKDAFRSLWRELYID